MDADAASIVAGVDGCRAGWFVALQAVEGGRVAGRVVERFEQVLELPERPSVIAVDIPIGLLEAGVRRGRGCDRAARSLLGRRRGSSVFSPPVRAALEHAHDYGAAVAASRAHGGIGLSRQAFGIVPKIAEVDACMTPPLQDRVHEVHPEVCFLTMNHERPMNHCKKTEEGRLERLHALRLSGFADVDAFVADHAVAGVGRDDVIDAVAACWTAGRIRRRCAAVLPERAEPMLDSRGLRMQIWR